MYLTPSHLIMGAQKATQTSGRLQQKQLEQKEGRYKEDFLLYQNSLRWERICTFLLIAAHAELRTATAHDQNMHTYTHAQTSIMVCFTTSVMSIAL